MSAGWRGRGVRILIVHTLMAALSRGKKREPRDCSTFYRGGCDRVCVLLLVTAVYRVLMFVLGVESCELACVL